MSRGLPRTVRENLAKARSAAIAAVEVYNRPGPQFRTAHYIVLMTIAWTGLFHAWFFRQRKKPWYRESLGRRTPYKRIDGEPVHWDLTECLGQYYKGANPPVRANLRFIIGLRNKIEHRDLPELDPALYGECQALLLNFEEFMVNRFGQRFALAEQLAVALQFSSIIPREKAKALKRLGAARTRSVRAYIEEFRAGLPPEVLTSTEYGFSVYLIPKTANRINSADIAVEFVPYDPNEPDRMKELEKEITLIKEKQVPVQYKGLLKPGQVRDKIQSRIAQHFTLDTHTRAWRHYRVRPPSNSLHPEMTDTKYCIYDELHHDYGYTNAWVELLAKELSKPERYVAVVGTTT